CSLLYSSATLPFVRRGTFAVGTGHGHSPARHSVRTGVEGRRCGPARFEFGHGAAAEVGGDRHVHRLVTGVGYPCGDVGRTGQATGAGVDFEVGSGPATALGVVLHHPVVLGGGDRQDTAVPLLQLPQVHVGGLGPVVGGGGVDIGGGEGDITAAGGVLVGQ